MPSATLPTPSNEAQRHSQKLVQQIIADIDQKGGVIPFFDFMQQALYAQGLGYYSAGSQKFGAGGDFITAPELSPLFSQCIAKQCQQVLETIPNSDILEFGAGSGIMAANIMKQLNEWQNLPTTYFILEPSPDLQQRQKETIKRHCPALIDRFQWLQQLPTTPLNGIVLANEVLDAFPVQRFRLSEDTVTTVGVAHKDESLYETSLPINDPRFASAAQLIQQTYLSNVEHYCSEWSPLLAPWLLALAKHLDRGLVLLIDYGFPAREYYHPDRCQGTLMCHYQHYAHADPYQFVGLQDITAHVDFTAVAQAAEAASLDIAGYTTQANFLLNCGITDFISPDNPLQDSQAVKKLTLPHEMGELFKVMALSKDFDEDALGFSQLDLRHKL